MRRRAGGSATRRHPSSRPAAAAAARRRTTRRCGLGASDGLRRQKVRATVVLAVLLCRRSGLRLRAATTSEQREIPCNGAAVAATKDTGERSGVAILVPTATAPSAPTDRLACCGRTCRTRRSREAAFRAAASSTATETATWDSDGRLRVRYRCSRARAGGPATRGTAQGWRLRPRASANRQRALLPPAASCAASSDLPGGRAANRSRATPAPPEAAAAHRERNDSCRDSGLRRRCRVLRLRDANVVRCDRHPRARTGGDCCRDATAECWALAKARWASRWATRGGANRKDCCGCAKGPVHQRCAPTRFSASVLEGRGNCGAAPIGVLLRVDADSFRIPTLAVRRNRLRRGRAVALVVGAACASPPRLPFRTRSASPISAPRMSRPISWRLRRRRLRVPAGADDGDVGCDGCGVVRRSGGAVGASSAASERSRSRRLHA